MKEWKNEWINDTFYWISSQVLIFVRHLCNVSFGLFKNSTTNIISIMYSLMFARIKTFSILFITIFFLAGFPFFLDVTVSLLGAPCADPWQVKLKRPKSSIKNVHILIRYLTQSIHVSVQETSFSNKGTKKYKNLPADSKIYCNAYWSSFSIECYNECYCAGSLDTGTSAHFPLYVILNKPLGLGSVQCYPFRSSIGRRGSTCLTLFLKSLCMFRGSIADLIRQTTPTYNPFPSIKAH